MEKKDGAARSLAAPPTQLSSESTSQDPPSDSDLLAWALHYAAAGVPVLPCKWWLGAGSKAPLLLPPGFHLATTDPMQITDWWIQWPKALIGSPVPATRCAIDLDPRNGGSVEKLEELAGPINPTLTVWSGRTTADTTSSTGGRRVNSPKPASKRSGAT
jgi:Bifunctional DNA primase/polymerase, N-terminal